MGCECVRRIHIVHNSQWLARYGRFTVGAASGVGAARAAAAGCADTTTPMMSPSPQYCWGALMPMLLLVGGVVVKKWPFWWFWGPSRRCSNRLTVDVLLLLRYSTAAMAQTPLSWYRINCYPIRTVEMVRNQKLWPNRLSILEALDEADFARLAYFSVIFNVVQSMDECQFLVYLKRYCEGDFWPGRFF